MGITQTDAANVTLNVSAAQWNPNHNLWDIFSDFQVNVSGVSADNAIVVAAQTHVSQVGISDTRANIQNNWDDLQAISSQLTGVTVTNNGAMTITSSQVVSDAGVLSQLSGTFSLSVTDALVSDATSLQAMSNVSAIAIEDTANNIANAIGTLNGLDKITSIAPTDSSTIELTQAQFDANSVALSKISNQYTVTVV